MHHSKKVNILSQSKSNLSHNNRQMNKGKIHLCNFVTQDLCITSSTLAKL